jgi:hypothetical protein
MAESYSHKFGQIIGDLLEAAVFPHLEEFAQKHDLYLDKKGERLTRKGKKLTWIDGKNNKHDLDFVLERGGTDSKLGDPVAFIETAWRRYTKHSRNKAQEIQGAIMPLVEKYSYTSPFTGVVLAGEFTEGSLTQLRSLGFSVLYFPYATVIQAFAKFGIDASSDEDTPELEFKKKIEAWERLPNKHAIAKELMSLNSQEANRFFKALESSILRSIESIIIWPLHGQGSTVASISEAIDFLNNYSEGQEALPFVKYEIMIKYNTGSRIDAVCMSKKEALDFLKRHATT